MSSDIGRSFVKRFILMNSNSYQLSFTEVRYLHRCYLLTYVGNLTIVFSACMVVMMSKHSFLVML